MWEAGFLTVTCSISSSSMWDLIPWPGNEFGLPNWGALSLTTGLQRCPSHGQTQVSHITSEFLTVWATVALTITTLVSRVMPLLFFDAIYVCHSFSSKELATFNFVVTFTIHSDFGVQENKICCYFHFFSICLPWSDGTRCHNVHFFEYWVLSLPFHSPLSLSSRGSSFSVISVAASACLRLSLFLPEILIPDCASSSPAFLMMYSAYKLNK